MGLRGLFRFSLRTLVLFALFACGVAYVKYCWEPWVEDGIIASYSSQSQPCLIFTPDSNTLIYRNIDITIRDLRTGETRTVDKYSVDTSIVQLSHSGRKLLLAEHGQAEILDLTTLAVLTKFSVDPNATCAVFSPNDNELTIAGERACAAFVNVNTGMVRTRREFAVSAVAYSPDGRVVVFALATGHVEFIDSSTDALLSTYEGSTSRIGKLTFSSDGHYLLCSDSFTPIKWGLFDFGRRLPPSLTHLVDLRSNSNETLTGFAAFRDDKLEDSFFVMNSGELTKRSIVKRQNEWQWPDGSPHCDPAVSFDQSTIAVRTKRNDNIILDAWTGLPLVTLEQRDTDAANYFFDTLSSTSRFSPDGKHLALIQSFPSKYDSTYTIQLYHKLRDEHWYGLLPSVGLATMAFFALIWSFWRDRRVART